MKMKMTGRPDVLSPPRSGRPESDRYPVFAHGQSVSSAGIRVIACVRLTTPPVVTTTLYIKNVVSAPRTPFTFPPVDLVKRGKARFFRLPVVYVSSCYAATRCRSDEKALGFCAAVGDGGTFDRTPSADIFVGDLRCFRPSVRAACGSSAGKSSYWTEGPCHQGLRVEV